MDSDDPPEVVALLDKFDKKWTAKDWLDYLQKLSPEVIDSIEKEFSGARHMKRRSKDIAEILPEFVKVAALHARLEQVLKEANAKLLAAFTDNFTVTANGAFDRNAFLALLKYARSLKPAAPTPSTSSSSSGCPPVSTSIPVMEPVPIRDPHEEEYLSAMEPVPVQDPREEEYLQYLASSEPCHLAELQRSREEAHSSDLSADGDL